MKYNDIASLEAKKLSWRMSVWMLFLAMIVGILAGIAAIVFQGLVAFFHNVFFLGHFSFKYHENVYTYPSAWGIGVIFIPILGGLAVIWLIETFARDEKGLSVPEIMYKLRKQNGNIRPKIALAKTLASVISIGSGASIGREGPVVQMGAAISSFLGNIIHIHPVQRKLLVAAGVAGATAAIFHAPLTGIAFVIELFVTSTHLFLLVLISLSSMTAILVEHSILGSSVIFSIHAIDHVTRYSHVLILLPVFVLLGVMLGCLSAIFIRGIYGFEDVLNRLFKYPYLRQVVSMCIIGIMLSIFITQFGHYYIDGIGFATIQDCLDGVITNPWLLMFVIMGKLLATCLSLGSGASGGIFSPALFIGATSGTFFGLLFNCLFPDAAIHPVLFTMAGMAGVTAGMTGAVVTSILLMVEITHNVFFILPVLITASTAHIVRLQCCKESVYTLKLARRGISL